MTHEPIRGKDGAGPGWRWRPAWRGTLLAMVVSVLAAGFAAAAQAPFVETEAGRDDAPVPVTFPQDDGPHDALIEWWYYTGHLFTEAGDQVGFEFVVFKGERDGLAGYASHFAVTDPARGVFRYDQRLVPAPDVPQPEEGFDLRVRDWRMAGAGGHDRLVASMEGYAISLLLAGEKPPVLHDGDGYIDYGSGEASYYYSRTRMAVTGVLSIDGEQFSVTGDAWMDHQWGDFSTYDEGGWDWYALQLDDATEVMLYVIRAPDGTPLIVDGSLVAEDGTLTVLDRDDFTVTPQATWTSPATGITYPSGWAVEVPGSDLVLEVLPVMPDQELDTRPTTGVIYWEGAVTVAGTRAGVPVSGLGYVELTGYGDEDGPTPLDSPAG